MAYVIKISDFYAAIDPETRQVSYHNTTYEATRFDLMSDLAEAAEYHYIEGYDVERVK